MELQVIGGALRSRTPSTSSTSSSDAKNTDETYLRRHPKMIENEAATQSVAATLERAIEQVRLQIESEFKAVNAEVETLTERLSQAEQEVLDGERAMVEYRRKERQVDQQREIYSKLLTRFKETSISQRLASNNLSVLERASRPTHPSAFSKVQLAAAAVFLAGVFFVSFPLAVELTDSRVASFRDIEIGASKELLGHVRMSKKRGRDAVYRAFEDGDEEITESFRSIFSTLRLKTELFFGTRLIPGDEHDPRRGEIDGGQ